jgi:hypothetical protein
MADTAPCTMALKRRKRNRDRSPGTAPALALANRPPLPLPRLDPPANAVSDAVGTTALEPSSTVGHQCACAHTHTHAQVMQEPLTLLSDRENVQACGCATLVALTGWQPKRRALVRDSLGAPQAGGRGGEGGQASTSATPATTRGPTGLFLLRTLFACKVPAREIMDINTLGIASQQPAQPP